MSEVVLDDGPLFDPEKTDRENIERVAKAVEEVAMALEALAKEVVVIAKRSSFLGIAPVGR